jgi:hypothetical protein
MNAIAKPYLILSATMFGLVCLAHVARVLNATPVLVDGWSAPMAVSWVGALVTAALSIWGFRLARRA